MTFSFLRKIKLRAEPSSPQLLGFQSSRGSSYIDARSNTTTVIRNSILYICTNDIFFKQHSPNQSAREKLARLSRGFIHALGIPMRARGHGLHGRRKLVDPIGPPAKKLQQI